MSVAPAQLETRKAIRQNSKFAPAGFGLGESIRDSIPTITDCNVVFANGWHRARNCINCPTLGTGGAPINYGWLLVSTGDYTRQDFYGSMTDPAHCVRYYVDGIWGEWEWVNPFMSPGAEYRTTERWQGKPVYTKSVDCGEVTDGKVIDVGVRRIISSNCVVVGDTYEQTIPLLPFKTNASSLDTYGVGYIVNGNQITLVAGTGVSNLTAITAVKYIKG